MRGKTVVRLWTCDCCRYSWDRKPGELQQVREARAYSKLIGMKLRPRFLCPNECYVECRPARALPRQRAVVCTHLRGNQRVKRGIAPLKYKRPPKVKPTVDRKLKNAEKQLKKARTRVKRARTIERKWERRVKYYTTVATSKETESV